MKTSICFCLMVFKLSVFMKHRSEMLMLCVRTVALRKKETEEEGNQRDLKMWLLVLNAERSWA